MGGYRRMLFVGLGGSGGKTLRFLKRDLLIWLDEQKWTGGIPQGIQFLHIDSPTLQDDPSVGGGLLARSEYEGLVSEGITLRAVIDRLDGQAGSDRDLTGWRIDPETVQVDLTTGAGQMRAVGRSVSLAFAGSLRTALNRVIGRIDASNAQPELDRLYQFIHSGELATGDTAKPITVFVSSLAGGTGAGLLFDVLDIFRSIKPEWADGSVGLWYTPDTFASQKVGDGIHPNSLAAVSEILNASWWSGRARVDDGLAGIPKRMSPILQSTAGISRTLNTSGVAHNYLIGTRNVSHVEIERDDSRLFETVGGALMTWVSDAEVQDALLTYEWGNQSSRASDNAEDFEAPWNYGDGSPLPVFNSLGFSRVSLGTRYLRAYAAERLAKDALKHLSDAHVDGDRARHVRQTTGLTDPDRIVEQLVAVEAPLFRSVIDVTGVLTEAERRELHTAQVGGDPEHTPAGRIADLMLNALIPDDFNALLDQCRDQTLALAKSQGQQKLDAWVDFLAPKITRDVREQIEGHVSAALPSKITAWSRAASEQIPLALERSIGAHGLRLAAELIEDLAGQLTGASGVVQELEQLVIDNKHHGDDSKVTETLRWQLQSNVSGESKFGVDSGGLIEHAIDRAVQTVAQTAHAIVQGQAATLLTRCSEGLLEPLARTVRRATSDLIAKHGDFNTWPEWNDHGEPSRHLLPPKSEYTVIPSEDFGRWFAQRLRLTYQDKGADEARMLARTDIAAAKFVRDAEEGEFSSEEVEQLAVVATRQAWVAGYDLDGGTQAPVPAAFDLHCSPSQVRDRADRWVMRRDYPFEELLSLNLRTYTEAELATPVEDREGQVFTKLREAIAGALPLVEFYDELVGKVHPKMSNPQDRYLLTLSQVPFRNHPSLGPKVQEMLEPLYRGREPLLARVLAPTSELPHIDILSSLWAPVSPVVLRTLLEPIGDRWASVKHDHTARARFWRHRRARPLGEFVPLPQAHLRASLRGWFTGRMLGLIDHGRQPVAIVGASTSSNPRWLTFPDALLSPDSKETPDLVARILEALSLAIVDGVNTDLASLQPYVELLKLGMSHPNSDQVRAVLDYPRLNPVLLEWVEGGKVAAANTLSGVAIESSLASAADDPVERLEALEKLIARLQSDYQAALDTYWNDRVSKNRLVLGRVPLWPGLESQILAALSTLHSAVLDELQVRRSGQVGGPHL